MARKIGTPLDFQQNELRNARAHISASAPSTPVTGQYYYHSGDNTLYVWNGSTWKDALNGETYTAGDGLTLTGTDFDINVDNSSIEINADSLRVKALGITNAMLAGSIALSKLATDPLARANHTGTQAASTISDLAAVVKAYRLDEFAAATNPISGVTPTGAAHLTTKGYVDGLVQGVRWLGAQAATTANITLSGTQTIDGRAVVAGEKVLVKNQTAPAENGLYTVAAGAWTRDEAMNAAGEIDGKVLVIEDGAQAGTLWVTTSEVTTLGTDAIAFTQFNSAADITGGNGLTKSGNDLAVNVDGSSIEISSDALRVKALGITNAMLAGSIAYGKLALTGSIVEADLADDSVNLSDSNGTITGTLGVGNGGTGQTTAKAGRETGLGAAGYYTSATHGAVSAGGTITITQATHGLRSSQGLGVWTIDVATGDHRLDDVNVAANGDVVITFTQAQTANSIRTVIVG